MKFDTIAQDSGIGANSYKIEVGYRGPQTPYDENVIQQTHIDGTVEMFQHGSRDDKETEFEIILLGKAEFLTLESFFNDNIGTRIRIEQENSHESIFMENFSTGGVYFASLIEIGGYQEDDFSGKRQTFRLKVKLAEPVANSGDDFNSADTGNLNVLIEVNTVQAKAIQASAPDPSLYVKGDRWVDTTNNLLKEHSGATFYPDPAEELTYLVVAGEGRIQGRITTDLFDSYTFTPGDTIHLLSTGPDNGDFPSGVYEIARKVASFGGDALVLVELPYKSDVVGIYPAPAFNDVVYTPVADNASIAYTTGVFRWASSFTMNSASYPGLGLSGDFEAGFINHKSIKLPGQSVDINKGPKLVVREGFSFSVRNNERFWKTIVDSGIPLFGSKITLYIYRNTDIEETLTKVVTGTNITNTFSYTDYVFQVEPFLLNAQTTLPTTTIEVNNPRYENVREDVRGEAPYLTYGQFDIASLQDVSKLRTSLLVSKFNPPYDKTTSQPEISSRIVGAINDANGAEIFINARAVQTVSQDYGFTFTADQLDDINNLGGRTVNFVLDTNPTNQDNVGLVRVIESLELDVSGDFYTMTLSSALPTVPPATGDQLGVDERIHFYIVNASYEFQFNEVPSGGFGIATVDSQENFVYVPDNLRLLYLAENNKDLIDIPNNEFAVNPNKNSVRFSFIGVNDPDKAVNFKQVILPEGQSAIDPKKIFAITHTTLPRPIGFEDGSGVAINPAANINGWVANNYQLAFVTYGPGVVLLGDSEETDPFGYTGYFADGFDTGTEIIRDQRVAVNPTTLPIRESTYIPADGALYQTWGHAVRQVGLQDECRITAWEHPVTHYPDLDASMADDSKVVIGINMEISCQQRINTTASAPPKTYHNTRIINEGIRLIMRIKMKDGTYRYNSNWEHTLTSDQCGFGTGYGPPPFGDSTVPLGTVAFNNIPNQDTEGGDNFASGVTLPSAQWTHDIDWQFTNRAQRDTEFAANPQRFGHGTKVLVKTEKAIDRLKWVTGVPGSFSWEEDIEDMSTPGNTNIYLRLRQHYWYGGEELIPRMLATQLFWDGSSVTSTVSLSNDDSKTQVSGRDLFDISELFSTGGAGREWENVDAIQFYAVANDTQTSYVTGEVFPVLDYSINSKRFVDVKIQIKTGPILYNVVEDFTIEDRPLFSAVEGAVLTDPDSGDTLAFPNSPSAIVSNIMERMYPGKTNTQSIIDLMALSNRGNWKWRRQFIGAVDSEQVLNELMLNLWAVLRINEDDQFEFVSLNQRDYTTATDVIDFNDSNIIKDSITNPKFRKTDEIFQRYELQYNFNPVSDFSESVPEWRNSNLMANTADSSAPDDQKYFMGVSNSLYGTDNLKKLQFKYHYDGDVLPVREWVVDHFVFNAWTLKLKTSIDKILGAEGLKIMDWVTVKSYFHTGDNIVGGFITKIQTDFYTATCTFTIFIPRPLGYLGPLCDPFNDASVTGRVLTAFTQNDAGVTGDSRGSHTQKDAGTTPREITC